MSDAKSILVLVTSQTSCDRLIRTGRALCGEGMALRVLSIQPRAEAPCDNAALEHLFTVSSEMGATMAVYYSDTPIDTTRMYVRRYDVGSIVVGSNPSGSSAFITKLHNAFPELPIVVVQPDSSYAQLK